MNDKKIRKLVLAALLAALVCVATMVVQIPSPMQGYVNLGDCFVLLSGWLLGPWYGFAAGGIGSMLADIFLGYAHYAPGTLVIKGVMALVAALMYEKMGRTATSRIAGGVVSEIIMVLGYFGYASLLLGKGLAAAASIPGNIFQGAVGLVVGVLLVTVVQATQQAAADKDCDTLVYTTYRDAENEIRILNAVAGSDLAGVVFTMMPQSTELVERVNRLVPVVVIGDRNTSLNVDTVEMNNYSAGAIIAHYMIGLGQIGRASCRERV